MSRTPTAQVGLDLATLMPEVEERWRVQLSRTIDIALGIEKSTLIRSSKEPLRIVTYLTLIQGRRYCEAISGFPPQLPDEARVLIRGLLEVWGNIQWIRVRKPHRRASRFLWFELVERVKLLEKVPPTLRPAGFEGEVRRWKQERAKVRHLFRFKNKTGKLIWARSWSNKDFAARLREVATEYRSEKKRPTSIALNASDIYFNYSWFSGTVHGSTFSFSHLTRPSRLGLRPDPSLRDEFGLVVATAAILLRDLTYFAVEDLPAPYTRELTDLTESQLELMKDTYGASP